ncbi:MAG: chemotaxis protein CheW [Thermodesulfobacteriota bacterium]
MTDPEILQDYISEARELLEEMDMNLLGLEKEGAASEILNNVFRAAHSIKGAAQYIGLERTSALTHGAETLLDRLREGVIELNPDIIEFLFRVKDCLSNLTQEVESQQEELSEVAHLLKYSESLMSGEPTAGPDALYEESEEVSFELGTDEDLLDPDRVSEVEAEEAEALLVEEEQVDDTALITIEAAERLIPEEETGLDVFPGESTVDLEGFPSESTVEIIGDPAVQILYSTADGLDKPTQVLTLESESLRDTQPLDVPEASPTPTAEHEESVTGQLDAGTNLAATVPHLLNLSLFLDDLEDGVNVEEGISSIVETVGKLIRSMEYLQLEGPAKILRIIENKAYAVDPSGEPVAHEHVRELRGLLTDLRPYYPADLFPWKETEPVAAEPEPTAPEKDGFYRELEKIPGFEPASFEAIRDAGFSHIRELARVDMDTLLSIPGLEPSFAERVFEAVGIYHLKPRVVDVTDSGTVQRSMLSDVDEDLLGEFDSLEEEVAQTYPPALSDLTEKLSRGKAAELISELGTVVADTDRELMEIFLAYGWEILDKLRPILERMERTAPKSEELQECADHIKAIRSSSTYMDLQKLAGFLEEWYEKALWSADRVDTTGTGDLEFMKDNFEKFQDFLHGMEIALRPDLAQPAAPAPPPRKPVAEEPKPRPKPSPPVAPSERPAAAAASARPEPKPTAVPAPAGPAQPRKPTPSAEVRRAAESPKTETRRETSRQKTDREWSPVPAPRQEPPDESRDEFVAMTRDTTQEAPVVRTMRVDAAKVDQLLNQVGELVVNRSFVEQLAHQLKSFQRALAGKPEVGKSEVQTVKNLSLKVSEASLSLSRVVTEIQEGVMKLRMLPVGQLFNRMPRLIRDLSRRVGKSVDLRVSGADTEVDKRVIEQVYNPLVHLIRNAVDHGIEDGETRRSLGKKETGTISLSAYSMGNYVVIDVEDDGQGIDTQAVLDRALENRLIDTTDVSALSTEDIHNFIFRPGFSTSRKVTRTSGRGVGMDVVRKDVEKINGHVDVQSEKERGTRISIRIPLTLAIIQTLLIKSGPHAFAIPLTSVREIIQIAEHEIRTIEGFEVIKFRDETIPILRVDRVFNLETPKQHPRFLILTTTGQKTVGFLVERLLGEQDVVIKPLAEHVCEVKGLAGSTILGDGTIALVMDISELVDGIVAQQRDLGLPASGFMRSQSTAATKSLPM